MRVILILIVIGCILVTVGGLGLHFTNKARIKDIESGLRAYDNEIIKLKKQIRILEQRDQKKKKPVVLPYGVEDLKYGGEGI